MWDADEALILADIGCSFLQQVKYPATLEVGVRVKKIGSSSMQVEHALFYAGTQECVATARAVVVWFDFKNQRSAKVPDSLRADITALEVLPLEQ